MKNKSLYKNVINAVISLVAAVLFLITFVESSFIPSWREIFGIYESVDNEAEIISFIDVGQGDAVLIQSNGRFALIDTGESDSNIVRTLKRKGIKGFDAVILSHFHSDHCDAFYDIANSFIIENAVLPKPSGIDESAVEYSKDITVLCDKKSIKTHNAKQGMVITVGEINLTVLYCDTTSEEENNRSLIVMAEYKDNRFLFTGDAEENIEEKLLSSNIDIDCDVLKAGHHGSSTSNTVEFLKKCSPEYIVISVGKNNSYGHPHREVLDNFYYVGANIYRTDYDGTVEFNLKDEGTVITTQY